MKVIFTRPKNDAKIFSIAIRLVEKREFSHSAIVIECPTTQREMVFHAASGMVHAIPYLEFCKDNIIVESYEVGENSVQTWDYCLRLCGTKYSVKQILSIFVQKVFRIDDFYSNGEKEQICSEFVYMSPIIHNKDPKKRDSITPSDLRTLVRNIYG